MININCFCCGSSSLEIVMEMSNLPLTGYYIKKNDPDIESYFFDQSLMICKNCGHGQLKSIVNPKYLYNSDYSHRGSLSPIASGGNHFFLKFLIDNISGSKNSIIDIGCNDLLLINLIKENIKSKNYYGLDPIWIGKDQINNDIKIIGKFSEDLSNTDINGKLDLIVSCHTFEHISDPADSLKKIASLCSDDADFFIEVPSFETLIELDRIDQIFHQHVNYFSVNSITELFKNFGFGYVSHTFNYEMWGGTMILHFKKGKSGNIHSSKKITNISFINSLERFKNQIDFFKKKIAGLDQIHLFGAAQMLPVLLYHIDEKKLNSTVVYDNNTNRIGLKYPHLDLLIQKPPDFLENKTIVITALDSYRTIFNKISLLKPKRIIDILNIK